jgi:hypothetical protein
VDRIPAEIYKIEGPALEFRVHDLIKLFGRKKQYQNIKHSLRPVPFVKTKGKTQHRT